MKKLGALYNMLRQVLEITPKEYKRKIPKLFIYMIASSLLELLSVAMVMPFVDVILNADELMRNTYIGWICNVFSIKDKYALVLFFAFALITAFLIKNVTLLAVRQYQSSYGIDLQKVLSTRLLKSYLSRPYSFFLENNTGAISGRINGDTNAVYNILLAFLNLLSESFTVLMIGFFIFTTDPVLAIGVLFVAGLCVIIVTLGLKKRIAAAGVMNSQASYANSKELMQALNGIKEISILRRRQHFVNSFNTTYEKKAEGSKRYSFYNLLPERVIEVFFVSSVILVVTYRMRWGTDMTQYLSKLAAFAMAAYRLLPSISKYTSNFNQLIYYQPYLTSAFYAIREAESYKAETEAAVIELEEDKVQLFSSQLEIRDITFRYRDELKPVLSRLSLTIHKGEAIGLVGESGAGKSTLADVILGLLIPEQGGVYMDGHEIHTIPVSWSKNVGYVPQSVYLVDGSIRENVCFGMEKEEMDDEDIWNALDRARLKEFVEGLEGRLDAHVGERGVQLSGGQRQRVAIARALYLRPTILVLDEATSALDNETEAAIMESIEHLMGSITLIIVAHRLTTIRKCDRIYEITNGRAEVRTKEELGII